MLVLQRPPVFKTTAHLLRYGTSRKVQSCVARSVTDNDYRLYGDMRAFLPFGVLGRSSHESPEITDSDLSGTQGGGSAFSLVRPRQDKHNKATPESAKRASLTSTRLVCLHTQRVLVWFIGLQLTVR